MKRISPTSHSSHSCTNGDTTSVPGQHTATPSLGWLLAFPSDLLRLHATILWPIGKARDVFRTVNSGETKGDCYDGPRHDSGGAALWGRRVIILSFCQKVCVRGLLSPAIVQPSRPYLPAYGPILHFASASQHVQCGKLHGNYGKATALYRGNIE